MTAKSPNTVHAESTARGRQVPKYFEFFAGGGMVRAGLGQSWQCAFANDFDPKKVAAYRQNWGSREVVCGDVNDIGISDLPRTPHLVWASFPCQDLSLAGGGAGLKGDRSGTFWPFWQLVQQMGEQGPLPDFVVLENVCGALTSHEGRDFSAIVTAFRELGLRVGAMVIDAELFVPQSRPRLFFIGVPEGRVPQHLIADAPHEVWHPASLKRAYMKLSPPEKAAWLWWQLPVPKKRTATFADLLEKNPSDVAWHTKEETDRLIGMMSAANKKKLEQAKLAKKPMVGAIYKRTRTDSDGRKRVRAEIRFDDVAGCLRTPSGGSSRQTLMIVNGRSVKSRLISARETARLMGLPESYVLPTRYNDAYHLTGDGVVVPVITHLSENIFLKKPTAVREVHDQPIVQIRRRSAKR